MYSVSVTNNYIYALQVVGGKVVPEKGGQATFDNWGSHRILVPGMGEVNFIDLGDRKLEGYTNPKLPWTNSTWGGLIRYKGIDAYFRYEGQGQVHMTVDSEGSVALSFPQGGEVIRLDDLTVPQV